MVNDESREVTVKLTKTYTQKEIEFLRLFPDDYDSDSEPTRTAVSKLEISALDIFSFIGETIERFIEDQYLEKSPYTGKYRRTGLARKLLEEIDKGNYNVDLTSET